MLYDGPLSGPETLWRDRRRPRRSPCSARARAYLQLCQDSGYSPAARDAARRLRAVLSTGLDPARPPVRLGARRTWARVPLQSISGGTDIVGCFVLGNPNLPVRRGWIQCRSLGLDVQALRDGGDAPGTGVGELVCRNPFPSRPLGFVGDDAAAASTTPTSRANPGVWTHGDLIELDADGPGPDARPIRRRAEHPRRADRPGRDLPRAARRRPRSARRWRWSSGRGRASAARGSVLLVVLREPASLDGRLTVDIRRAIVERTRRRRTCPSWWSQVDELPVTHSGKRSERAARDALNGLAVVNSRALRNPRSLDQIRRAVAMAAERRLELAGAASDARAGVHRGASARDLGGRAGGGAAHPGRQLLRRRAAPRSPPCGSSRRSTIRWGWTCRSRRSMRAQTIGGHGGGDRQPERERGSILVSARATARRGARCFSCTRSPATSCSFARSRCGSTPTGRCTGSRRLASTRRGSRRTHVEEMAAAYVAVIRSVQPTGPYALAGHSFGGLVAFEMARHTGLARAEGRAGWG